MTKEKLLAMMTEKPVGIGLFIDQKTSRLYRTHYMGMGDRIAVDASEYQDLVDKLLQEGSLVQTGRLIGSTESRIAECGDVYRLLDTGAYRCGYAIEVKKKEPN